MLAPSNALLRHLPAPTSALWNRATLKRFSVPALPEILPVHEQALFVLALTWGRSEILPLLPPFPERSLLHSMCVFRFICRVMNAEKEGLLTTPAG